MRNYYASGYDCTERLLLGSTCVRRLQGTKRGQDFTQFSTGSTIAKLSDLSSWIGIQMFWLSAIQSETVS